jgi:hypothetical protein
VYRESFIRFPQKNYPQNEAAKQARLIEGMSVKKNRDFKEV